MMEALNNSFSPTQTLNILLAQTNSQDLKKRMGSLSCPSGTIFLQPSLLFFDFHKIEVLAF